MGIVWMVALVDQNSDGSVDGRQLGDPGQAEGVAVRREVRVEAD